MNIDKFKTSLAKGGVRGNLFRVQGDIGNTSLPTKVGYLCKSAALPSTTIEPIEVQYRGRTLKLPGDRTYAEWTLTFYEDGDFELRNAFEKWMDDINQTVDNVATADLNLTGALFPDWSVEQLDRKGDPIKSYKLLHCWPSEVGEVSLSYDETDLQEFTVTLQYTYFLSQSTDESVGLGIAAAPGDNS
jgi:hypothetical protein